MPGALGCGIERDRVIDPVLNREGQLGISAIDRAGAGIDHVFNLPVAGEFEQVDVAREVGGDIGLRIVDRIAHPGLRPQMHHPVDLRAIERRIERGHVREVECVEGEAVAARSGQRRDPITLQADLIIVVEVIDPDNNVPARQQALGEAVANKSGSAGNQNAHENSRDV
jgi:hypothetical protein